MYARMSMHTAEIWKNIEIFFISIHTYKDVSDIDGIITEFARLKGTHLALCLMASLFYPFLP